jgi:heme exporter protein C
MNGDLARIIVFHLPCAFAATIFLIWSAVAAIGSLATKGTTWDIRTAAAMEMSLILCVLTMLTGILFSYFQWGALWQNDPRQWSFLLVLLIVAAYFALRAAYADEQKMAQHTAAYVAGSALPVLFLIFVLPRIPSLGSFHPSNTIVSGGFSGEYWWAILGVFAMLTAVSVWLYALRVSAGLLEAASLEKEYADVDAMGGGAASTGVVRPIALPRDDREES